MFYQSVGKLFPFYFILFYIFVLCLFTYIRIVFVKQVMKNLTLSISGKSNKCYPLILLELIFMQHLYFLTFFLFGVI